MKLRRIAALIEATGNVARVTGRAIRAFERTRPHRTGVAIALLGAGVALGSFAASPNVRKQVRQWLEAAATDDVPSGSSDAFEDARSG